MKDDVKIPGWPALDAGLANSREANASAVFNSGGNLGVNGFLLDDAAFAFALRARIADYAARALAGWASPRDAEETLLVADLATSTTGAASRGGLALCASRASARIAILMPAVGDFSFSAEDGFLKFDSDIFAEISASLGASTASRTSTTASKKIAKTEELAEDIAEIVKDGRVKSGASSGRTYSRMAKAIVQSAFFGVGEHRVSFARFLEFFFRVGIIWIAVRMKLHRKLAVGALDLLLAGTLLDSQHVVVIAF